MTKEYFGKVKLSSAASMSEAQRWQFMERRHEFAFSTVNADGVIYNSPLFYTVKDRRIFIPIDQASTHLTNIENGSKIGATVFDGGGEMAITQGIVIEGRGELLKDKALAKELVLRIVDHVFGIGHPHKTTYIEYRDFYDNLTLELIPEKMITWDMRKLYRIQLYTAGRL